MRTPLSLILHSNCETQLTFTEKKLQCFGRTECIVSII